LQRTTAAAGSPAGAAPGQDAALVLVADDDPVMRLVMSLRLGQWGYRVMTSADGEEALRALRAHPVDVVLLDVQMPKLDGYGVLAEIGRTDRLQPVSVILLSGNGGGDAVVRGLTAGAEDYLPKPFVATELEARLRAVVARRASTRALLELQAAVVSPAPLSRPAVEVRAVHRPAAGSAAGGDFHALVDGPDGSHVVIVGDVIGHGPTAAAFAAHLRTVFANRAHGDADPGRLLDHLNSCVLAVGEDADSGAVTMVTAACVTLHARSGGVSWAVAGHPQPVLLPPGEPLPSDACGVPLGVLEDPGYAVSTAQLRAGQGLLLYTDGLTEARRAGSAQREEFGDAALPALLPALLPGVTTRLPATAARDGFSLGESLDALLEHLLVAHEEFTGGATDDDLTVLACACTPSWARGT
jgi:CheY-like chemotaxis protein